jgi:hypothetical protein
MSQHFDFAPNLHNTQSSLQALAGLAIAVLILRMLVAIVAAAWMFKEAESRGKNGIAAALIALLSAFYGIPCTVIVVCAWILFRPDVTRREISGNRLPEQLPAGIEAAPSSEEFLERLKEKS